MAFLAPLATTAAASAGTTSPSPGAAGRRARLAAPARSVRREGGSRSRDRPERARWPQPRCEGAPPARGRERAPARSAGAGSRPRPGRDAGRRPSAASVCRRWR